MRFKICLQALLSGFTGGNTLALVGSTLAIAALFQRFRRRIQATIDRRFYRRKYDAARTIAAFSATLHGEIELNALSEQLVTVVQETMQPAFVSLWLQQYNRRAQQQFGGLVTAELSHSLSWRPTKLSYTCRLSQKVRLPSGFGSVILIGQAYDRKKRRTDSFGPDQ